jgi:hypothetical protein
MDSSIITKSYNEVNHTLVKTAAGAILVSQPPAAVSYDRSARVYRVANGRLIGEFPAGPENKVRAEWLALSYNDGRLYEAAQAMVVAGHDEKRTLRAAGLILEGRVIERYHEEGYTRATILASRGNRSPITGLENYQITHNLIWRCECEDYVARRDIGERHPLCKHILAVMLIERIEGEQGREQDQITRRQFEHQAERNSARLAELRAECDQCHGRGTVTGVDTWTGRVVTMKCSCQIDF